MAASRTGEREPMTAENQDHLVGRQARRPSATQPLPRVALRSVTIRSRRERGRVESLPQYRASLLRPSRRPKCTLAVLDTRRSSSGLPGHTPRRHGISCLQYNAKAHIGLLVAFRRALAELLAAQPGRVGGDRSAPPLVEPDVQISRIRLSRRCRLRHAQLLAWPFGRVSISCKRGSGHRVSAKPSSVVCVSAKRLSLLLTPHFFCKAPSLRGHYPASSLLRASPPPSGPFAVIDSRFPLALHLPGGLPRFLNRSVLARRPQPPRRSRPVLARFFPAHGRLHPIRRTGRSRILNEAESGSLALRLTSPPARGFNAPGFPSRCSPASCCTSNYMVNSFRPLDLPDLSWRTE